MAHRNEETLAGRPGPCWATNWGALQLMPTVSCPETSSHRQRPARTQHRIRRSSGAAARGLQLTPTRSCPDSLWTGNRPQEMPSGRAYRQQRSGLGFGHQAANWSPNPSTTDLPHECKTSRIRTQIWGASSCAQSSGSSRLQNACSSSGRQLSPAAGSGHGEQTIGCPIAACNATFSCSNLLAHLLDEHLSLGKQDLRYAHDSEISELALEPRQLTPCRTVCLGVVLFCGKKRVEVEQARAVASGSLLQELEAKRFREYLPVLVLGQHTFLDCLPEDDKEQQPAEGAYLVWAQSAGSHCTTRPLYASITAFNGDMTQSRSCLRRVAPGGGGSAGAAAATVDGIEQPLLLTDTDMAVLRDTRHKAIRLEVIIHEQPTVSEASGTSHLSLTRGSG